MAATPIQAQGSAASSGAPKAAGPIPGKARFSSPSTPASVNARDVARSVAERERARAAGPVRPRGRPPGSTNRTPEAAPERKAVSATDVRRYADMARMGNAGLARLEKNIAPIMAPEPVEGMLVVSDMEADAWGGATANLMGAIDPDGYLAKGAPLIFFAVTTFGLIVPRVVLLAEFRMRLAALKLMAEQTGGPNGAHRPAAK